MPRRKKPQPKWLRTMPMNMRSQLRNDLVNTGRGPSIGALEEYKARTKSMMDGFEPVDRFLNTPAGRVDMKRQRLKQEGVAELQRRQHIEREYVVHAADIISAFLGPDARPDYCVVLTPRDSKYVDRMYTTDNGVFFLRHNTWNCTVEKSGYYSNAEVAKSLYVSRMIKYKERISYPAQPDASG